MRSATIDHEGGGFMVTVYRDGRRENILWGSYAEVIRHAVAGGVPRDRVTLTPRAQKAALETCFGGAP